MSFSTACNNAESVWFGPGFAEEIVYAGETIYGHVDFGKGTDRANASRAVIEVAKSDVAEPAYRDSVIIDGVTWYVYRDLRSGEGWTGDGLSWRIPIIRDERPGMTR
jgi:hypothetical protein